MKKQFSEEELEQIAAQLSCPSGTNGIAIAEKMNENNSSMTLDTIQQMKLSSGQRILELGHGNARHLAHLLAEEKELNYCGVDISELMYLEATTINAAYIERNQASFHLYSGTNIPFHKEMFDQIFTVNTIYFWEEQLLLLEEIHRVLKPKGHCHLTFAQKEFMLQLPFSKYRFNLYNTDDILQLLEKTPFTVNCIVDRQEEVQSKIGETVLRDYTIISIQK